LCPEIAGQRLFEPVSRLGELREQRVRMPQAEGNPCAGALARAGRHLRHALSRGVDAIDARLADARLATKDERLSVNGDVVEERRQESLFLEAT
jgi:hypothetical protein